MPNVILKCSGTDGTAMTLSQGPDTNMDLAGTFEINPLQLYFLDGQGYMECSHASRFFYKNPHVPYLLSDADRRTNTCWSACPGIHPGVKNEKTILCKALQLSLFSQLFFTVLWITLRVQLYLEKMEFAGSTSSLLWIQHSNYTWTI